MALIGGGIVAIVTAAGLLAPFLAPYDPVSQNLYSRLEPPSLGHIFGTDDFGRDIFSRVIHGSLISIRIGVFTVFGALIGAGGRCSVSSCECVAGILFGITL